MSSRRRALAAGAFAAITIAAAAPALSATTVRWMHIEQNPDIAAFYADVARRFEAAHPGTKVEMQYLENESFKKKLTTLLQSPEKPHIIYSWAGGVLREQVKAGVIEELTPHLDARWRSGATSPTSSPAHATGGRWATRC